jgi:hypothetical protein
MRGRPSIVLIPQVSLAIVARDGTKLRRTSRSTTVSSGSTTRTLPARPSWAIPVAPGRGRLGVRKNDEPCAPYLHVLRDMFAELKNGHTEVLVPEELGSPTVDVDLVEGKAVVTRVEHGSDAEAAGLAAGVEILDVDGIPVAQALHRIPEWRIAFTSSQTRTMAAYHALLEGPSGSSVKIRFVDRGNEPRTITLARLPIRYDWEAPAGDWRERAEGGTPESGAEFVRPPRRPGRHSGSSTKPRPGDRRSWN